MQYYILYRMRYTTIKKYIKYTRIKHLKQEHYRANSDRQMFQPLQLYNFIQQDSCSYAEHIAFVTANLKI